MEPAFTLRRLALGEALVFIHGFALDARMWDPQFEVFAQRFSVIRYDLRGFGRSSVPTAEGYSHAEDLHALLCFLRVQQAHIVGLSLGGLHAVNFGLLYPEATKSLILAGSALDGFVFSSEFLEPFGDIEACAKRGDVRAANQLWLNHTLFAPARENPAVEHKFAEMVGDYSGWHWANKDPIRPSDPPAIICLRQIRAPTLVLVGARDLADFCAISDLLARDIPGAGRLFCLASAIWATWKMRNNLTKSSSTFSLCPRLHVILRNRSSSPLRHPSGDGFVRS